MSGYLPPGCTQDECDRAQPGYYDEPEDECHHEDYDPDILTGYATCNRCGHRWYQTRDEIEREREAQCAYDRQCREWEAEERKQNVWWRRLWLRWRPQPRLVVDDELPF